jgi:hypothetical protein
MKGHMKEVAKMLSCSPASVVEVLKEKLTASDWLDICMIRGRRISNGSRSYRRMWSGLILRQACSRNR